MNKFVCIIGILACALGLEGGYRILALVNFFNGADAPFYLFTLITFITCIVCFAIFLTGKKHRILKTCSIIMLLLSLGIFLLAPNVGAIQQALIGGIIALLCLILARPGTPVEKA